jgi:hypothetical protein
MTTGTIEGWLSFARAVRILPAQQLATVRDAQESSALIGKLSSIPNVSPLGTPGEAICVGVPSISETYCQLPVSIAGNYATRPKFRWTAYANKCDARQVAHAS